MRLEKYDNTRWHRAVGRVDMTIGMILVFFEQYIVAMKILIFISFLEVTFSFFFIFYPLYSGSDCVYSNVGFVSYGYLLLQNLAVKLIMTPELRHCASLKRDREFPTGDTEQAQSHVVPLSWIPSFPLSNPYTI